MVPIDDTPRRLGRECSASGPLRERQALHPLEFAPVIAHQTEAFAAGLGGEMEVVHADRTTLTLY
ncbi:MAG: hypothetical protein VKI42_08510 [Synechococcaceae cyanobacterium]|nr:hypothetical protein [Synechococcaceae cyanobacterium]